MAGSPTDRTDDPLVSVVITVKNEERHLPALLASLAAQSPPYEIVLVDALSHDRTLALAEAFRRAHPGLMTVLQRFGSRGIGRNAGVAAARGRLIAFIDGDCEATPGWVASFRSALSTGDLAAGKTVLTGAGRYAWLERVELYQRGNDVTYPSCNLAYRRALFERLGGFDPRFITAEDIDLNLRAIRSGAKLVYVPDAVVQHHARPNLLRFVVQAFWNGYGRKQLTEKHGSLWGNYRMRRLFLGQRGVLAWVRLAGAFAGYGTRVLTGGNRRLTPTQTPAEGVMRGEDVDSRAIRRSA